MLVPSAVVLTLPSAPVQGYILQTVGERKNMALNIKSEEADRLVRELVTLLISRKCT
jgi:predicted transcriptional regulator